MQQYDNGQILYSLSDLATFLGCQHASFLDAKSLSESIKVAETSTTERLLQKRGLEHEAAHLQCFKDEGKTVVEIPRDCNLQDHAQLTLEAMRSGADVIYRAVFLDVPWCGYADFLLKCSTTSALGDFSYEVLDTKLTRTAEPKHIMQLCFYSEILAKLQDFRPVNMYLFLGDGKMHSFRVADFFYYYNRVKQRFEVCIQNLPSGSYPEPCNYCSSCHWRDRCKSQWEADSHLSLVANIQRSQRDKLCKAGIKTLADLAGRSPDTKIPGLSRDAFLRLRAQAVLQHHKTTTGEDKCEIILFPLGKGFTRMPAPDNGDLFFDMEGDPLYSNGLEYLFGVYYRQNGQKIFKSFWAHDHEEEKKPSNTLWLF